MSKSESVRALSNKQVSDTAMLISNTLKDTDMFDDVDAAHMALSMLQVAVAMAVWSGIKKESFFNIAEGMWEKFRRVEQGVEESSDKDKLQ